MDFPWTKSFGPSHLVFFLSGVFFGHPLGVFWRYFPDLQDSLEVLPFKTRVDHSPAFAGALDHSDSHNRPKLTSAIEECVLHLVKVASQLSLLNQIQLRASVFWTFLFVHPSQKPQYCVYPSFSKAPVLIGRRVAEHSKIC